MIVLDQLRQGLLQKGTCPAGATLSTCRLCPPTERVDHVTMCLEAHRVVPADGWSWPLAFRGLPARCMGWHKDTWKIPHVCTPSRTICEMTHHSAFPLCGGVTAEVDRPLHATVTVIMFITI